MTVASGVFCSISISSWLVWISIETQETVSVIVSTTAPSASPGSSTPGLPGEGLYVGTERPGDSEVVLLDRAAILQATVSPEFQGRVFALWGSIAGATAPIGLALAAQVAQIAGVRMWYLASGVVCVGAGLPIPVILHLDDQKPAVVTEQTKNATDPVGDLRG